MAGFTWSGLDRQEKIPEREDALAGRWRLYLGVNQGVFLYGGADGRCLDGGVRPEEPGAQLGMGCLLGRTEKCLRALLY